MTATTDFTEIIMENIDSHLNAMTAIHREMPTIERVMNASEDEMVMLMEMEQEIDENYRDSTVERVGDGYYHYTLTLSPSSPRVVLAAEVDSYGKPVADTMVITGFMGGAERQVKIGDNQALYHHAMHDAWMRIEALSR